MRSSNRVGNFIYRLFVILMFVVLPFWGNAQSAGDPACGDSDPFQQPCPLDTWVIALVVIAGLLAALHLHRKQKIAQA